MQVSPLCILQFKEIIIISTVPKNIPLIGVKGTRPLAGVQGAAPACPSKTSQNLRNYTIILPINRRLVMFTKPIICKDEVIATKETSRC
jgi:hypothetical protein